MNLKYFIIYLVLTTTASLNAQIEVKHPQLKFNTSFAIIVDRETYQNVQNAIDEYRASIENDGLSSYIIINEWNNPDEIRELLIKLYYEDSPLEGAVFIGDIPIPMLSKAQHLTSAHKADDERYSLENSSVPSDRFYDDFDLKFKFIQQDSINKLFHYYSLLSVSTQKIDREIYTARIKPPVNNNKKYEVIENYLLKVIKQKSEENIIDNMMVFTGHSYFSESLTAWSDENLALHEQFPQLYKPGGKLKKYYHDMSPNMKDILINDLQKENLDIAIFHAHGEVGKQFLINNPYQEDIAGSISSVKYSLREKLRKVKNYTWLQKEMKNYFINHFGISESWFKSAFDDSVIAYDEKIEKGLTITSNDIDNFSPNAKFIVFDACYNGAFHKENYIAGKYVFNDGDVIAAEANTVKCLQDKWANENIGLLSHGMRIGNFHKFSNFLESHIIGDPTFRFKSISSYDLNEEIVLEKNNIERWKNRLINSDPNIRAIAVSVLTKNMKENFEDDLINIYKNDPSIIVRMYALKNLAQIGNDSFNEILKLSIDDPFELIRRISAIWMGEIGKEEYLPFLVEHTLNDESKRVVYNAKNSLGFISTGKAIKEVEKHFENNFKTQVKEDQKNLLLTELRKSDDWLYNDLLPNIRESSLRLKSRIKQLNNLRSYHFHESIPDLILLARDENKEEELRVHVVETLGWYNFSYQKNEIFILCNDLIADKDVPLAIKDEAIKTKNRLITGLNNSMIP